MKKAKHITVLFFVTMMLLFKVTGLHALAHHSDVDVQHCEVCHMTTMVGLTPLLETEVIVIPESEFCFPWEPTGFKSQIAVFSNKHLSSYLFTRPPPRLY